MRVCVGCWRWGAWLLSTRHHSCQGNAALWLPASRRTTTWCCSPLPQLRHSISWRRPFPYLFWLFLSAYFYVQKTKQQQQRTVWLPRSELTCCKENIANKTVLSHKVLTSPWEAILKSGEECFCLKCLYLKASAGSPVIPLWLQWSRAYFYLFCCVISF